MRCSTIGKCLESDRELELSSEEQSSRITKRRKTVDDMDTGNEVTDD